MRASALPYGAQNQPIPADKIPSLGYWRVLATLRTWLQILGVKDICAAREEGPEDRAIYSVDGTALAPLVEG